MRRKTSMILCVGTFLFLSGCNTDIGSSIPSSASPTESVENSETIAIKYMKEKYDLDCTVVKVYGIITGFMGDSFDQVLMRPTDDPNGDKLNENEGQRYLDLVNFADQYGSTFAVYTDPDEKKVIGDQYMLYSILPLFNNWINEQISLFAPCQPCCRYLELCTTGLQKYDYCFSPDFPLISSYDDLETQIPKINVNIRAYYQEYSALDISEKNWIEFTAHMKEQYLFSEFSMKIFDIPESVFKTVLTDEIAFRSVDPYQYHGSIWSIWYDNLVPDINSSPRN